VVEAPQCRSIIIEERKGGASGGGGGAGAGRGLVKEGSCLVQRIPGMQGRSGVPKKEKSEGYPVIKRIRKVAN